MSDLRSDNDKSVITKAYVREMLDLNPMWQSAKIIRRRRELWTADAQPQQSPRAAPSRALRSGAGATSDDGDDQASQQLEDRARQCLDILQRDFYRLPENKLHRYIQFLHNDRLPGFAVKANRLETVAKHRESLLRVAEETGDEKFSYSLLRCLVCPASEAGSVKEQYIESIVADRRVKPSCRMVDRFVTQHPQIYDLERDWFNLFLDKGNQSQWARQSKRIVRSQMLISLAVVVMICFVVLAIVAGIAKDKKRTNPRPQRNMGASHQSARTQYDQMMKEVRKARERQQNRPSPFSPKSLP